MNAVRIDLPMACPVVTLVDPGYRGQLLSPAEMITDRLADRTGVQHASAAVITVH